MSKKCLILLSFVEALDREQAQKLAEEADYLICADGGQTIARKLGLLPDCVVGDFDSTDTEERFSCLYLTYPAEKDLSDSEAALLHAVDQDCDEIVLLGGLGGRLDHTLGNLALLCKFAAPGREITFLDARNRVTFLQGGTLTLEADPRYRYFGLIPVDAEASGITVRGAKYELTEARLMRAGTHGISNEIEGRCAEIRVKEGALFVTQSSDAPRT